MLTCKSSCPKLGIGAKDVKRGDWAYCLSSSSRCERSATAWLSTSKEASQVSIVLLFALSSSCRVE